MTVRQATMRNSSFEPVADNDRRVRMICSTETVGRDRLVLVSRGIDLRNYRENPVWLWGHDPNSPVARSVDISVNDQEQLVAEVEFPPAGVSAKSDWVLGLLRAKTINAASTGFEELDAEPIDPADRSRGWRITKAELMEMSFVSVPAVPDALASERSQLDHGRRMPNGEILRWFAAEVGDVCAQVLRRQLGHTQVWACSGATDLPVADDPAWDAEAAAERVFAAAGWEGETPDTAMAQRAFAAYDNAAPRLKRSYGLPFADIVDGKLTAIRQGLASVEIKLDSSDLSDSAKTCVRSLLKAYAPVEEPAVQEPVDDGMRFDVPTVKRALVTRGVYDIGALASVLENLGWIHESAQWEEEFEKDGSAVPAMLGKAIQVVGEALLALTAEEVAEMMARVPSSTATEGLTEGQVTTIQQSNAPELQRFLTGLYRHRTFVAAAAVARKRSPARMREYHLRMRDLLVLERPTNH